MAHCVGAPRVNDAITPAQMIEVLEVLREYPNS